MRIAVRFRILLPLLLSLVSALPAETQTASLVLDIQPGPSGSEGSSSPEQLFAFRGKVFFSAEEPSSGRELWVSDGEGSGTRQLTDFCPGLCSSNPHILGNTRTVLFGHAGGAIWRSDGTRDGTFLLPSSSDPLIVNREEPQASVLGGILYLSGCNQEQSCGLWRSDGTSVGTRQIYEGTTGHLAAAGKRIFFRGDQSLWVTDGTPTGSRAVKEFNLVPRLLATLGDRVLFTASTEEDGPELWVSDGTAEGTRALTSFAAPEPFRQTLWLKPLGGKIYFVADDVIHGAELWVSDGTAKGTRRITEIGFFNPFAYDGFPFDDSGLPASSLELLGNRLIFWATDGLHGFQPWSTTGSLASTAPVCAGCSFTNGEATLLKLGSRILFNTRDTTNVSKIWATDGTSSGTVLLRDLCPGACDAAGTLEPLLGSAFFTAFPEPGKPEIWITNGTPAGTRRFAAPGFSFPLAALGSTVYYKGFSPNDGYGFELWASDGTPRGTRMVTEIARENASSGIENVTPAGDGVYFTACRDGQQRFWYSAGSAETTVEAAGPSLFCGFGSIQRATVAGMLFFISGRFGSSDQLWRLSPDGSTEQLLQLTDGTPNNLLALNGRLIFFVRPESAPMEVWRSDGTAAGTVKVATLPSYLHPSVSTPTVVGSQVWWGAYDNEEGGSEIWSTDGTEEGTRRILDFGEQDLASEPQLTLVGSTVFFLVFDEDNNQQVWKTDGTQAGTSLVKDLDERFERANPSHLTAFQGKLYFFAETPNGQRALWRSDGTAEGTIPLLELPIDFQNHGDLPAGLIAMGSQLFFIANDGAHGREPWVSDGTAAGTVLLRDVLPGQAGSGVTGFQEAAGQLFFTANDGAHGFELWRTDGTAAGTRIAQDLAPEGLSSYPRSLAFAGGRLFFTADDGETGEELWTLPLSGPPCQPSAETLCLAGGRFQVKISWRDFAGRTGSGHAVPLTTASGYFWLSAAANVDVLVKILDGQSTNGHFGVYSGALTNVEYTLTVTDTQTGLTRRYFNPLGQFTSVGDGTGFGRLGAHSTVKAVFDSAGASSTCAPTDRRLCLNGGRFAVEVRWTLPDRSGNGTAVGINPDTGYFWFSDAANAEVAVRVVDGTAVNGRFWVYYGGLTNVEYELTVTDMVTGKVKTYKNLRGRYASAGDRLAF
jgi:ELWxxDGT repeat protein